MGVTRKEKLLKAMLEDNATGCGGGVTRFEKMLAGVAKKTCENDVLEGGGGNIVIRGEESQDGVTYWCDTPYEEFKVAVRAGTPVVYVHTYTDNDNVRCYYNLYINSQTYGQDRYLINISRPGEHEMGYSELIFKLEYSANGIKNVTYE